MRLGWIVLAHRGSEQLGRLVQRLACPADAIFLHIDRRVELEPFVEALRGLQGVSLLPRRRVRWGTYDVVSATLAGMRAALKAGCDYVSVISGQDYPIKPIEALREHLTASQGTAFMLYFALPNRSWSVPEGGLWRVNRRHYRLGRLEITFPNRFTPFVSPREMPRGMTPFAGSNWWTLPRDCVEHAVEVLDRDPAVSRFYRRAAFPAEGIFQTILLSSPLRDRVVLDDLRYVVWNHEADAHPQILDASHLASMAATPSFLARKFDAGRDPELLDLIDERLLGMGRPWTVFSKR